MLCRVPSVAGAQVGLITSSLLRTSSGVTVADLFAVVEHHHPVGDVHHTPMSCSISTTVVPNSFTSSTKRDMSRFSLQVHAGHGSSSSSTCGSTASARPRSTRFCRP